MVGLLDWPVSSKHALQHVINLTSAREIFSFLIHFLNLAYFQVSLSAFPVCIGLQGCCSWYWTAQARSQFCGHRPPQKRNLENTIVPQLVHFRRSDAVVTDSFRSMSCSAICVRDMMGVAQVPWVAQLKSVTSKVSGFE